MKNQLKSIERAAQAALADVHGAEELEAQRVRFLGKKGELTALLKQMGGLPAEERPVVGALANEVRARLEEAFAGRSLALETEGRARQLMEERLDVTISGPRRPMGHRHPNSIVLDEVREIFLGMGFSVAEGPEVETTYYCFDALGIGENHPARDVQDTFYFNPEVILRTQTSSVQIRTMEKQGPPVRIISPGRTYRKDEFDATHSPVFHQIEGLVVDRGVTMAHLKGTLLLMLRGIFGEETQLRFRPHFFPYTEPSAEVDIRCYACHGAGCRMCKGEGWIELLGCGMVHPDVLRRCGIDPEEYSGFAFGVGLDRLAIMRFAVSDLRLLFENDMRFLSQF